MAIREVELPGVGKKYTVETQATGQLVIVLHRTGKREIYHFAPKQTVPNEMIDLTAEEAQQVGGILSQTHFEATPDLSRELVMKQLVIDWLLLPAGHLLTEKNIREMAIRRRTGASLVAILREGKTVINPDPDETLRAGDTIMMIGTAEQIETFKRTFQLPAPGMS
jgi:TrkA domain protein